MDASIIWLFSTHHIFIGALYILSGIIGGSFGLALSIIIRVEIALPGFILCSSLQYNSLITFHGILMIFFMIMPLLIGGFGNLLIPLMLCCYDMIFPRLNALSLWLLIDSLFLIWLAIFLDGGINTGWTFYIPLSSLNYSSIDIMFFSLHYSGLSSLFGSFNFIISIYSLSILFIYYYSFFLTLYSIALYYTSLLLIISIPVLAICITMIIYDRHFNSSFFDPLRGGDILLFQHLFWFFGHPEVYILILPAFGLISEIFSKYILCLIFARDSMLISLFIIVLIGCMVWGHHMFMIGFDIDTRCYFTSSTSIISIPTGIKILNWFSTLWSSILFKIAIILFIIGFLLSFNFGGFTGLILSNCIIDILLHDSYFVVGHFHYILSLGAIYTFFSSFYNYSLLFTFYFNEFLSRIHFSFFFISSNLIFFSMHSLGIFAFPRRIFDYPLIFLRYHWINSFGILGTLLSILCFILSFILPSYWERM